jgi:uncharacterized protein (UPF0332 family)
MTEYNNEDYVNYRIQRAKETIEEVATHIENKFWNTAINRMYYACFYAVSALLAKHNIVASTHSGIRQQFGQHFVLTGIIDKSLGKHFTDLFEKRHKGDYNDFYEYDEETVLALYPKSLNLISRIDELLENNNSI